MFHRLRQRSPMPCKRLWPLTTASLALGGAVAARLRLDDRRQGAVAGVSNKGDSGRPLPGAFEAVCVRSVAVSASRASPLLRALGSPGCGALRPCWWPLALSYAPPGIPGGNPVVSDARYCISPVVNSHTRTPNRQRFSSTPTHPTKNISF